MDSNPTSWVPLAGAALLLLVPSGPSARAQLPAEDQAATGAQPSTGVQAPAELLGGAGAPLVDRVWHQPPPPPAGASQWLPQPIIETIGKVVSMTDETLQMESPAEDQPPIYIAVERIVWMEPAWSVPPAREGMQAFVEGRYAEAIPLLIEAVRAGPPQWQQQWLSGHMAMAANETGRYAAALELVAQLDRSGMPMPMFALLPIRWTSRPVEASAVIAARERIDAAEPAVRLVAASWMLSSPATRGQAERALDALSVDGQHPWIARLADAVRWRRTPVPQIETEAAGWIAKIDQLPIALQGGPLLCAADRLDAAAHGDQARELFWAAALLHRQPRPIADQAHAAAESSDGLGEAAD